MTSVNAAGPFSSDKVEVLLLLLFTFNSRLEAHAVIFNGKIS